MYDRLGEDDTPKEMHGEYYYDTQGMADAVREIMNE